MNVQQKTCVTWDLIPTKWHMTLHDPPDPPVPRGSTVRFKVGWILMVSNHPRGSSWGGRESLGILHRYPDRRDVPPIGLPQFFFGKRSWNPTGVDSYKTMICSISEHLRTCSSLNHEGRRVSRAFRRVNGLISMNDFLKVGDVGRFHRPGTVQKKEDGV